MTYDTKNRILQIGVYEKIKLSYREDKLFICLSSNEMERYEDILKELGISINNLRQLKRRLLKDTKHQLEIKTISKMGYKLVNEVYFE